MASPQTATSLRLDKWLWFARVVRTRALAQELVADGHVRVNAQRVTTVAKPVKVGDILTVALPGRVRVLRIAGLAERRGGSPAGAALYEEIAPEGG